MKFFTLLLLFAISFNTFSITCTDDYSRWRSETFSFPNSNISKNMLINGKICYKGRDITTWAAGEGMEATSFVIPYPDTKLALITINEENPTSYKRKSRIRIIFIDNNGKFHKQDLIKEHYSNEEPEQELTDMVFTGYDFEKGIVYFEVPAWATSMAIHAINIPINGDFSNVKERFIVDGSLKELVMSTLTLKNEEEFFGHLIVNRGVYVENIGREFADYIVSPKGEIICEANTAESDWRLNLKCKN
ncbi:hypothetical protein [Arsenophonus nasoniae]|uniref:hypothetical protein n=1 Tax=Arsenophonus nasoniae TaxID=638 RepID=UPI003879777D